MGEHVFPRTGAQIPGYDGMSLRDWFAGQLAPLTFAENYGNDWGRAGVDHASRAANRAYLWADALLKARDTPPAEPRKGEE